VSDAIYPLGRGEEMSEGEYQSFYANPDPDLMGEMAYVAACDEIASRADARPTKALSAPAGEWRTRDGRVLRVSEMTVDHLANAVALFERGGVGDHAKVAELREELGSR
jgi:hypothetical protein